MIHFKFHPTKKMIPCQWRPGKFSGDEAFLTLRLCNVQELGTPSGLSLAVCFWHKSRNEYSKLWTLAQSKLHFLDSILLVPCLLVSLNWLWYGCKPILNHMKTEIIFLKFSQVLYFSFLLVPLISLIPFPIYFKIPMLDHSHCED